MVEAAARSIVRRWSPQFRQRYGSVLPRTYLAFDLETTGFSREKDLIVEWGHCLVRDGQIVDRLSMVINWLEHEHVPANWVIGRLDQVRRQMRLNGSDYHITPELMRNHGVLPHKAFAFLHEFLGALTADEQCFFVAHNGCNFDRDMLIAAFAADYNVEFDFPHDRFFDTGALVKASQMVDDPHMLPQDDETLMSYFQRVTRTRAPGVKYSLDGYCVPTYRLPINKDLLHSASEDAFALHLLFERLRELAEMPEPIFERAAGSDVAASTFGSSPSRAPQTPRTTRRRRQRDR